MSKSYITTLNLIQQFLCEFEYEKTLETFENEVLLSQNIKKNDLELPSLLQIVQNVLDQKCSQKESSL
jgi:hypothetical protein